jgi:hypothetical protein
MTPRACQAPGPLPGDIHWLLVGGPHASPRTRARGLLGSHGDITQGLRKRSEQRHSVLLTYAPATDKKADQGHEQGNHPTISKGDHRDEASGSECRHHMPPISRSPNGVMLACSAIFGDVLALAFSNQVNCYAQPERRPWLSRIATLGWTRLCCRASSGIDEGRKAISQAPADHRLRPLEVPC